MNDIKVYSAESSLRKPGRMLREMWSDTLQSRGLAWRLAVRDISALYRQSFLGILWAFILPLANTVTWIFLRNSGIVSVHETDIPYPVYVFTGTMLWAIVTESLLAPLQKVQASKSMLTKINFPREAIILSGVYQTFFNSAIKIVLMLVGMVALGYYSVDWTILLLPVGILALILAGSSIGLILTPIGMLYTDIGKGLTIAMQFLMYATPVVFPIPKGEGIVATIITHNPLTPLIMTTRDWLTGNPPDFLQGFFLVSGVFLVIFFTAWVLYRAAMPFLIERMSA
jgi:lipopolysaccharide transport system permease protein